MSQSSETRWYFTRKQLNSTPSIRIGKFTPEKELASRQQAANFIQDMGQRLKVTQLCINTAIVYMHRFYMFHSFTHFNRSSLSVAAIFLAAKVEKQPRKIEYMINMAHKCLYPNLEHDIDIKSEHYEELVQDLLLNENVLLQTLGFDLAIVHPHTYVVQGCTLAQASKDVAQTAYFLASRSLRLTTMCLQYRPTLVACFCINLAITRSSNCQTKVPVADPWFHQIDSSVTQETLQRLTDEYLGVFYKCSTSSKREMSSQSKDTMSSQNPNQMSNQNQNASQNNASMSARVGNPMFSRNEDLISSQNKNLLYIKKGDTMSITNEIPMSSHNNAIMSKSQNPMPIKNEDSMSIKNDVSISIQNEEPISVENEDSKSSKNGDRTQEHSNSAPRLQETEKNLTKNLEAQASRAA